VVLENKLTISTVQEVLSQQPVDCSHEKAMSRERVCSKSCQGGLVGLALAPITVTINQPPIVPHQQLALSSTKTVFSELSSSPISNVVDISPIDVAEHSGLTFATANAISYGCTTFMAMRFAMLGLGGEVSTADLVRDIWTAFLTGIIICILLHWVQGGEI
jgi:hypothetical protein